MGVYVGAGVGDEGGVGVMLGVEVALPGIMDGIFEDTAQPNIIMVSASPRMTREIRFMRLLILVKQRHVKRTV